MRGVMPLGLAQDATHLYVTESRHERRSRDRQRIRPRAGPYRTGWFPAAAALSPDHAKSYVVNNKGKGAGPNGGNKFKPGGRGPYIGELELGSLSVLALPIDEKTFLRKEPPR